jgi:hypothetical protein
VISLRSPLLNFYEMTQSAPDYRPEPQRSCMHLTTGSDDSGILLAQKTSGAKRAMHEEAEGIWKDNEEIIDEGWGPCNALQGMKGGFGHCLEKCFL